jgi:biopolymer transport protein ExbB
MVSKLFALFLLLGTEWVLWILVFCSLLSMAVFIERMKYLTKQEKIGRILWNDFLSHWQKNGTPKDWKEQSDKMVREFPCPESRLLKKLAQRIETNPQIDTNKLQLQCSGQLTSERVSLDKFLPILGTLGNAAPFIGLFGTVLGIIKAFAELGVASNQSGLAGISGGLAEALVTTAVGLVVAIPCSLSYNYFQRKIKIIMSRAESVTDQILSND